MTERRVRAYFDAWRGGVVDTMIGMPASRERAQSKHYAEMNAGILDKEAREQFTFPAQYMFKDVPDYERRRRPGRAAPRGDGPLQHRARAC